MQELQNLSLAEQILNESGMSTIAFCYAGRGALYEDFISNGTLTLYTIYNRMVLLGKQNEFIKFVMSFNNLNAYDFITDFYFFARNHFKCEGIDKLKRQFMLKEPNIYRAIKSLIPDKEDETTKIKGTFIESVQQKKRTLIRV